jgi:hypothetical protein
MALQIFTTVALYITNDRGIGSRSHRIGSGSHRIGSRSHSIGLSWVFVKKLHFFRPLGIFNFFWGGAPRRPNGMEKTTFTKLFFLCLSLSLLISESNICCSEDRTHQNRFFSVVRFWSFWRMRTEPGSNPTTIDIYGYNASAIKKLQRLE